MFIKEMTLARQWFNGLLVVAINFVIAFYQFPMLRNVEEDWRFNFGCTVIFITFYITFSFIWEIRMSLQRVRQIHLETAKLRAIFEKVENQGGEDDQHRASESDA